MRRSLLPSLWGRDDDEPTPFRSLQREIDRVFEDFGKGVGWPALTNDGANMMPNINVSEDENTVEITAELPGVDEKDVEVTLSDNVLTIRGEKKTEKEDKDKDFHLVERSYGSFQRSIRLPFDVDEKKVEAKTEKGVLKIMLPKSEEAASRSKRIEIKPAS